MNRAIKYWDKNIAFSHIGTEINWVNTYLEENKIDKISYIDIGGNVGSFFDELSKNYTIEKCIIVEPSKRLYDYMKDKFKNNNQIDIYNFGISNENGFFGFDDSAIDYWSDRELDNSINLGTSKVQNSVGETQFYTMDYFMDNINNIESNKITFIKIDTENRDLHILKDLSSYLVKNNIRPLILFENNYHNDMSYDEAKKIIDGFCEINRYEKIDLSILGDRILLPKKEGIETLQPTELISTEQNIGIKKIYEILHNFKIDKKFWSYTNLSESDYKARSKPAPFIKKTIEIAKLLGLENFVEIGSTRFAVTQKCVDYFNTDDEPFDSPACCTDGHCSFFFSDAGFNVHTVDIDINCKTQVIWSFENLNKGVPENLTINIPKDGIEFLREHNEKIDILFLDGWDVGTEKYAEKHLESFMAAEDKLSDVHLILIDDTDFINDGKGKDYLLSPYLIKKGYIPLFNGRQTLFLNTSNVSIVDIQDTKDNKNAVYNSRDMDFELTDFPKVIISLSTTPNRINSERDGWGAKLPIEKLLNLSYPNYEVHFNIPYVNHKTNEEYIIPQWLLDYSNGDKLKIFRSNDYGSITKIVPTILRIDDPDAIIITVDDDILYEDGFIEYHIKKQKIHPNSALGFAGIGSYDNSCHFCTTLSKDTRVQILEGYKTVSYKRNFFKEDFFTDFVGKSWNDDLCISAYLGKHKIHKIVMNYNKDTEFNAIVESFPVIKVIPNENSGCYLYRVNSVDDNHVDFHSKGYFKK